MRKMIVGILLLLARWFGYKPTEAKHHYVTEADGTKQYINCSQADTRLRFAASKTEGLQGTIARLTASRDRAAEDAKTYRAKAEHLDRLLVNAIPALMCLASELSDILSTSACYVRLNPDRLGIEIGFPYVTYSMLVKEEKVVASSLDATYEIAVPELNFTDEVMYLLAGFAHETKRVLAGGRRRIGTGRRFGASTMVIAGSAPAKTPEVNHAAPNTPAQKPTAPAPASTGPRSGASVVAEDKPAAVVAVLEEEPDEDQVVDGVVCAAITTDSTPAQIAAARHVPAITPIRRSRPAPTAPHRNERPMSAPARPVAAPVQSQSDDDTVSSSDQSLGQDLSKPPSGERRALPTRIQVPDRPGGRARMWRSSMIMPRTRRPVLLRAGVLT